MYFVIEKAFDIISYRRLLFRLHQFGFDRDIIQVISSNLSNRTQRKKLERTLSSSRNVLSGARKEVFLVVIYFLFL